MATSDVLFLSENADKELWINSEQQKNGNIWNIERAILSEICVLKPFGQFLVSLKFI